ncbi:MAG: hypothetical protein IPG09_18420 [Ignavibacteria bacterium]|nr:hypothetical protein [Ignavibacteria bacterium]
MDAFLIFPDIGSYSDDWPGAIMDTPDMRKMRKKKMNSDQFLFQKDLYHKLPNFERGVDIIVQITKNPVGNKGIQSNQSFIPGRYLGTDSI